MSDVRARLTSDTLVDAAQVLLCIAAAMLAAAPWLRAFPASVGLVPLLGAAALSVLLSTLTSRRHLLVTVGVGLLGPALFEMLVVLRAPTGFAALQDGLVHGPSQLLTFALPLVSPRALLVDPVVLTWLCGAVAGAAVTRRWVTTMPFAVLAIAFGLSYAATQRAASPDVDAAQLRETLLGLALLACLLLLRALQVRTPTAEGSAPSRGVAPGAFAAVLVVAIATLSVQSSVFPKQASQPQRQPTVQNTTPLTPVAFVAGLRPESSSDRGTVVFDVHTTAPTTGYFAIANVDYYDGAGWSFDRTFRPSGGVVPADPGLEHAHRPGRRPDLPQHAGAARGESVDGLPVTPTEGRRCGCQRRRDQRDDRADPAAHDTVGLHGALAGAADHVRPARRLSGLPRYGDPRGRHPIAVDPPRNARQHRDGTVHRDRHGEHVTDRVPAGAATRLPDALRAGRQHAEQQRHGERRQRRQRGR